MIARFKSWLYDYQLRRLAAEEQYYAECYMAAKARHRAAVIRSDDHDKEPDE